MKIGSERIEWPVEAGQGIWRNMSRASTGEPPQVSHWHEVGTVSPFQVLQLEELEETSMPS